MRRLEIIRVPPGTRRRLELGFPPNIKGKKVVAWFHTHPNTAREGFAARPSFEDVQVTQAAGVPGIIETHEGRKIIPFP
jgi:hypothetical protein